MENLSINIVFVWFKNVWEVHGFPVFKKIYNTFF
jgi:hypothetical protein